MNCETCGVLSYPSDTEQHAEGCLADPLAIVRELAVRGPMNMAEFAYGCGDCGYAPEDRQAFRDPANHEPSCLWRRAKALYSGAV